MEQGAAYPQAVDIRITTAMSVAAGAMASAGKENTAPAASADTTELEAQLRESRMENELLQAELNSIADTAKTLKKQLECGLFAVHAPYRL